MASHARFREAIRWYKVAAEQGDSRAQNNLGAIYYEEDGVDRDIVQAYKWFNIAVASGNEKSRKARNMIYKEMTSDQIDKSQALAKDWMEEHQ